ncbi:MAG: c-type cytochrome [Bacteroidetes bacterium]|nr:c-type cytochrome [Bacteroidota bacterium]
MQNLRKLTVASLLIGGIIAGIAATSPKADAPHYKNLKVLPKNTTHEQMEQIMGGFKNALGVRCDFCHAPSKDSTVHHPDFASDDKPEKNIARQMMKMTGKINKKYFSDNKNDQGERIPTITCMTCHRGNPHPGEK